MLGHLDMIVIVVVLLGLVFAGTHIAIGYVDSTIKYSRPLDWQHADAALR